MPADKKSFLDLKFPDFSIDVRQSLKKLSLTELAKLADEIKALRGSHSTSPFNDPRSPF